MSRPARSARDRVLPPRAPDAAGVAPLAAGAVLVVLLTGPQPGAACPTLPLVVAPGGAAGTPPAFETPVRVSFPHRHVPGAAVEHYRVGAADGSDAGVLSLAVRKGPLPGEVTLLATPPCLPTAPFDAEAAWARELHVATTGTPGGDGTPANPFDTIARAAPFALPGDAIVVHEGAYPGSSFVSDLQGTRQAPIWITGAPGEAPPVLGSPAVAEALHLTDPAWLVLRDLEVAGPTGNGINIDDGGDYSTPAHHVVVRGVTIRDVGTGGNQDCLKLSGLDDFWILESAVQRCGDGGSGIDMVGCHRGVIAGNELRDLGASGIQAKGGSADVVMRGNLFVNAGARAMNLGGSTGLAFFRPLDADHEARHLVAVSNVVVGSTAPTAYVGCDGCVVGNNTFYLPERWVTRILQESTDPRFVPCRDGVFVNNVVVFDSATLSTFVNVGPDTLPETFTFANNLWFSRDDPGFAGPNLPVPETDPVIQQDPLLVDPAGEDFHLDGLSPARAAGTCFPELEVDRDGLCHADPPTLGAHL